MRLVDPRLPHTPVLQVEGLDHPVRELLDRWIHPFLSLTSKRSPIVLRLRLHSSCAASAGNKYVAEDGILHLSVHGPPARQALKVLSVIRAVFKTHAAQSGFTNLHAATLQHGDGGVLVGAERGGGKTTLVLAALREGFDLIGNDQAMVGSKDGDLVALGWPALTAVRESTVKTLGLPRHDSVLSLPDPIEPGQRLLYEPATLCQFFGAQLHPAATISLVVHYDRCNDAADVTATPTSISANALAFPLYSALGAKTHELMSQFVGDAREVHIDDLPAAAYVVTSPNNGMRQAAVAIANLL